MFAKKIAVLFGVFVVVTVLSFLAVNSAHAAPIVDFPITVTQPDGSTLTLYVSGDEFYNWMHDAQGYTVIQNPDNGYYVYAELVAGKLVPTGFIAGRADPAAEGLRPYLNISPEQREEIRQAFLDQNIQAMGGGEETPPTSGTINNLVIFIRFAGEPEFTNTPAAYTAMLNDSAEGANSLRNYYQEVSYGALTIDSTLFPTPGGTVLSYQDIHPRGYYQPYDAFTNPDGYQGGDSGTERKEREHTLLKDAITYVDGLGQFPDGSAMDINSDGYVDSLTFIVSGEPTGWSSLLWPHMWWLDTYEVMISGKIVRKYALQLDFQLSYRGTGILAHEMFHILGAPDLYHYGGNGVPVGPWDLMENDLDPPQHMGCYMKFKYGHWISSIPELSAPDAYTLNPLTLPADNCYKIASPYSGTEFFVVEYRNGTGSTFESSLPGSGMLVYRINTDVGDGNAGGPPDEVYIYRPGGTISEAGNLLQATFSSDVGRTVINDSTDPSSFLSDGSFGGLDICNIGAAGDTISFHICTESAFAIRGNAGVGGATLAYTVGGTTRTAKANNRGVYSFAVPSGWTGTVTPSKAGYTFDPPSLSYENMDESKVDQNYTATSSVNLLQDPGFEAFDPTTKENPYWVASSTNFGTPLCTIDSCGDSAGGAGPQTGSAWAWFGGTGRNETASLSQTVAIIPGGQVNLEFSLRISYGGGGSGGKDMLSGGSYDPNNVFTAMIDDVPVFSASASQIDSYMTYTLVTVDVSSFADGAAHTITFSMVSRGQIVNYNLDDVALRNELPPDGYTISGYAGAAGAFLNYTDGTAKTAVADEYGEYSFTVSYNWSGIVTPSLAGYTFQPAHRTYANVMSDKPWQDYVAGWTTTTTIMADTPDPSAVGQSVSVTVTVMSESGIPTGTVNITGADTNCSITLAGGTGSCDVVFNFTGVKTITAVYSGGDGYSSGMDTEGHQIGIQRAKNRGFNSYATSTSKIPKYWVKTTNFASTDGKDTSTKKEGTASVRIAGAAGEVKTLTQTLSLSGAKGQPFTFSYWVKARGMPTTGSCYGKVLFYYGSTLKGTKKLNCPSGATYTWKQVTSSFPAPATYNKVLIRFTYSKPSGWVWFDLVSLLR